MKAVVLIPVYNGEAFLRSCLSPLLAQEHEHFEFEVVALDNASVDASAGIIAEEFPQVRLIRNSRNLGFGGALNQGMQLALAEPRPPDAVVLLNQDTQVDPTWLAALLRPLQETPDIGIVGSVARFPDGRIQHAGGALSWPLGYGANIAWGELALPEDLPRPDYISGLAVALRTSMLQQIGLFDEGFNPGYYEDVDLCLRAVAAGWTLHIARDATLVHHEGAVTRAGHQQAVLNHRNRIRMVIKQTAPDALIERFLPAEREHAMEHARHHASRAIRFAYLEILLALPGMADRYDLPAGVRKELARAFAEMRTLTLTVEQTQPPATSNGSGQHEAPAPTVDEPEPAAASTGAAQQAPATQADSEVESAEAAQQAPATQEQPVTRAPAETVAAEPTPPAELALAATTLAGEPTAMAQAAPERGEEQQSEAAPARPPFRVGQQAPVSVIIEADRNEEQLQACLKELSMQVERLASVTVVVPSPPSHPTRTWLSQQPALKVVEAGGRGSMLDSLSRALADIPLDHDVLLLSSAVTPVQGSLDALQDLANSHADYGIVGCIQLDVNEVIRQAGIYVSHIKYASYPIGSSEQFVGQYPLPREVDAVPRSCLYIRRDVRQMLHVFDKDLNGEYAELDYCLRAQKAGFKVICAGSAQVMVQENVRWNGGDDFPEVKEIKRGSRAAFVGKWRPYYHQRYTQGLVWHSTVTGPTGYQMSSRAFVLELDQRGVDVRLVYSFGNEYDEPPSGDPRLEQLRRRYKDFSLPQVVYMQGDYFIKNGGAYRIGFTMLEVDGLPREWVNQANQIDEVWTPTHWGAEVFADSGIRRPIHVIPLGFDPNYFHPDIQHHRPSKRFTFLSIFDWLERKAPEVLLQAYLQEFTRSDDVLLILKVFNRDPHFDIQRHIQQLTAGREGPPVVMLPNQSIAPYQVGCLYRSADCFVLPTRGEGWGMPILEAMACGLPTIATNWGAQKEFFHEGVGYPLEIKGLVPAVSRSPYYMGHRWADPDVEHLRYLMRYVYEHPAEARAVGAKAAEEALAKWTWAHASDHIMSRLEEIQG